eukprot:4058216-Karenia_brevis.AAC.1
MCKDGVTAEMVTELSPTVVIQVWKWFGMMYHGINHNDLFKASVAPAIPKSMSPSKVSDFRAIVKD